MLQKSKEITALQVERSSFRVKGKRERVIGDPKIILHFATAALSGAHKRWFAYHTTLPRAHLMHKIRFYLIFFLRSM